MRRALLLPLLLVAVSLALAGCSGSSNHADPFAGTGSPYYKGTGPLPKGVGRYYLGKPYEVAGRWFTPKEQSGYDKKGTASWYGEAFHRRRTSNGEWFDMNDLTAAHPTLPLPSYVKVTNLDNGREAIVRVNDRGPFVGTRIIDLSKASAEALGFRRQGKAEVRVQYVGLAPIGDKGGHLLAMNRELERGTPLKRMIAAANKDRGAVQVAARKPAKEKPVVVAEVPPSQQPEYDPVPVIAARSEAAPSYYVQVGSFVDAGNAERARASLANVWPVQVIELEASDGPIYRVRLGPIEGEADAEAALSDAVAYGHPDAHLIVARTQQAAL